MSGNPLVMFEWRTRDASRLRAFYNAVFDWKYGEPAPTGWQPVKTGKRGRVESGIVTIPSDPNLPSGLICFFAVDDLEKAEERVRAHGGQVVLSARETANGRFTLFRDVDFNQVGLWEEKKKGKKKAALDPAKVAERTARKAAQKLKKQAERVAREQKRAQKAAERAAAKAAKKAAAKAEKAARQAQKAAKKAHKHAAPPTAEELQKQAHKAQKKAEKKAEAKAAKKAAAKAEQHAPITSAPTLVPTPDKR